MKRTDSTAPPDGLPKAVFFCFCGFLLVALNVIIDPRAMDISLMPRLLALLVFLVPTVAVFSWTSRAECVDPSAWRDPVVLCSVGYLLATGLSLFFAVNFSAGLSSLFRTLAGLVILLVAVTALSLQRGWPCYIVKFAVLAGVVSFSLGLQDAFSVLNEPSITFRWQLSQGSNGLMSNINLYASFLLLLLPFSLAAVVVLRRWWRWSALLVCAALLLMIAYIQTRAVYLGLAAGALVVSLAMLRFGQKLGVARWLPWMLSALLAVAMVGTVVFAATQEENVVARRLKSIVAPATIHDSGGRGVVWLATLRMAADRPLLGVGAGNFTVHLHDYLNFDDPEFSSLPPNWLQPHNDFLWVLAEMGIVGFLLYIGIFVVAFWHLLTALRSDLPRDRLWMAVFVAMGLTGYLVVSFFDFPMERINHQVYLALYLAMAVVLGREARGVSGVVTSQPNIRLIRWGGGVVISVLILGIVYATFALRQERFVLLAREAFVEEDWKSTVYYAQRAATPWKTLDPFATPVSYLEGWAHLMLADMPNALACLERARSEMPSRAYIINSLGLVHGMMGNHEKAIACYNEVLRRSPGDPSAMNDLARGYLGSGDARRALEILQEIPPDKRTDAIKSNLARAQRLLESGQ